MVFAKLRREPGLYSLVTAGRAIQNSSFSVTSGLLPSYKGHLRNLQDTWQGNTGASRVEAGNPGSLSSINSDIGIPTNFQEESGIVTF